MKASLKAGPWIAGTVVLALLILGLAWQLAIAPQLDSATDKLDLAEFEQERAAQLEIQLVALRADFARLAEFEEDLAVLETQIPAELRLADVTRQVASSAESVGITVVGMSPSLPLPIEQATTAPVAQPETAGGTETTDETSADGATTAPPPPPAPSFFATSVEVTLVGTLPSALAFLNELQTRSDRLVLVSDVAFTGQDEAGAENGRPATAEGDVELTVTMLVFTRMAPVAATDPAQPGVTPETEGAEPGPGATLPSSPSATNPFAATT